jgi:hypothetical protein
MQATVLTVTWRFIQGFTDEFKAGIPVIFNHPICRTVNVQASKKVKMRFSVWLTAPSGGSNLSGGSV